MALSEITKITGPGIHTLSNVLSHNIKSSGIITATKFVGPVEGSITATDATFSGNVSIAGTLTYEDVTNIDSVGIITAPAVDVDDFLDVGSNIKLGNAGVITATSFVGSGAALTGIDATAIKDSGGNVKIQAQASGAIHSGVSTFQDLDVDGHTNLDNVSVAGVSTFAGTTTINTSGNEKLILSGSSNPYIQFQEGTTNKAYIQWSSGGGYLQLGNEANSTVVRILSGETGLVYRVGSNNRTVWTSGNDGASSGLDADLLDGQQGSYYTNAANLTGTLPAIDGSNLTGITQTTINSNVNNYLITGTGTANTLQGESGLTWDGATLSATGSDAQFRLYDSTASSENSALRMMAYNGVNHIQSGKAFSSDSKADLIFGSMFGGTEWVRIDTSGRLLIGTTTEGNSSADNLTVADSGESGITVRSGTSNGGHLYFSDATSGTAEYQGGISYQHNGDFMKFITSATERLRIDTSGHIHTGYTSSFGADHINILATDGGGISIAQNNSGNATSGTVLGSLSIQGYLNTQNHTNAEVKISGIAAANHTGSSAATDMVFYTKPSTTGPGSAPNERLRITSNGKVGINSTSPQQALDVKGSINGGTENQPFLRFHDSHGDQRSTKHYFKCIKGGTTIFDILTVDLNTNFHQALIILYYGARIQAVADATTYPVHKIIGVNRFNGGSINFDKQVIQQNGNAQTHADIDAVATSSTQYRIRLTYSGTAGGSSFCCGSVEIIGVGSGTDGTFYSLAHAHGLTR